MEVRNGFCNAGIRSSADEAKMLSLLCASQGIDKNLAHRFRVGKPESVPIYRVPKLPKHEHSLLIRRNLVKMPKALRAEINDVVVRYTERKLRRDGTLDVAVMAHEMTQSLVDMIMDQDEHRHAPLLALMILSLGDEYLQRNGIGERRDN